MNGSNDLRSIDEKAMAMMQFVHTAIPESSLNNEGFLSLKKDSFLYLIFCYENMHTVFCACRIISNERAIKNVDVLNQFNLRSKFGACSFQKLNDYVLFMYRAEILFEKDISESQIKTLFDEISWEAELEFSIFDNL